jgi:hypothetical protein
MMQIMQHPVRLFSDSENMRLVVKLLLARSAADCTSRQSAKLLGLQNVNRDFNAISYFSLRMWIKIYVTSFFQYRAPYIIEVTF